jgi:ABC-2 type transport system permease protein
LEADQRIRRTECAEDIMTSTITTYWRVFITFARNSLVRDMTFRGNFIIDTISSLAWAALQVIFYQQIFRQLNLPGSSGMLSGWGRYEFYAFFSTGLIINALGQMLFMTNIDELTDMIRTGELDFLLLKPIDTQFLVSLKRIEWSSAGNFLVGVGFLAFSLVKLADAPGVLQAVLFLVYLACGLAIYYSLMISLGASTVWMGRNLTLYDFWFYITTFSRYPMEIYQKSNFWLGPPLGFVFTFIIPVLIVINVPARTLVWPLEKQNWPLAGFAILAAIGSVAASRWLFQRAVGSYRSASS